MLFQHLFAHASKQPQEIAVIDEHGRYSYQQLAAMSAGLGMYLSAQTKKPTVGLLLPAGAGFVASFYGTLLAGKSIVPINFLLGDKEIAHVIALTSLPQTPPAAIAPKLPSPNADDLAVLMYTSGTSGLPKGVMLTYENLHDDVNACIEHVELKGSHKFLGLVPLFHSTGLLATLVAPTYLGSAIQYIGRFSPVATIKGIREGHCTVIV